MKIKSLRCHLISFFLAEKCSHRLAITRLPAFTVGCRRPYCAKMNKFAFRFALTGPFTISYITAIPPPAALFEYILKCLLLLLIGLFSFLYCITENFVCQPPNLTFLKIKMHAPDFSACILDFIFQLLTAFYFAAQSFLNFSIPASVNGWFSIWRITL